MLLVVVVLLVFGAKRLPEIGRSLGSGMREFKDAISGDDKQPGQSALPPAAQQPPAPPVAQAPVAQPPVAQAPAGASQNPTEPQS